MPITAYELSRDISVNDSGLVEGLRRGGVRVRDFGAELDKTFKGIKDRIGGEFASMAERLRGGLESVADQIGVLGSVAGAAAAGGMFQMVEAASDLNESISKVGVVFKDSAGLVESFARTSATSLGISRQEALESAGTFGNLFSTMGLGHDISAQMSVDLVKLASDLASFNNADPSEMLLKLRSGLVGEIEPLRAVGVNIDAATTELKAMSLGLASNAKELTQSDKVMARYALILEQTKNAQGDFSRTSEGVANQMRIAKAQAIDLAAGIGSQLLPIAQSLLKWGNSMFSAFQSLDGETRKIIATVVGFTGAAGAALPVIAGIATGFAAMLSPIGLVVAAIGGLTVAYTTNFLGIRDAVNNFTSGLQHLWGLHGDKMISIAGIAWDSIFTIIGGVLSHISDALNVAGNIMRGDWGKLWTDLIGETDAGVTGVLQSVQRLLDKINPIIGIGRKIGERIGKGLVDSGAVKPYGRAETLLDEATDRIQREGISATGISATGAVDQTFNKVIEQSKKKIEELVKTHTDGGTKAGAALGKGVGGGAKKAMNDAFKEILADVNDFLKTLDKGFATVSERVFKSLSASAQKNATAIGKSHREISDAIQRMALEIQFNGDDIEEKMQRVRDAFSLLEAGIRKNTIEAVSHIKELGLSADSLPNTILPNFAEILKGQAEYNAKLQERVNEAGRIRQQEVDDAKTMARSLLEDQKKLYADLQETVGQGMAGIIKFFTDGMGKTLDRAKEVSEGIIQVVANVPTKWGDKLRETVQVVLNFVNQIDGILRGLHKIFEQIPDGLNGMLQSIIGVFRRTKQEAQAATASITSVYTDMNGEIISGFDGVAQSSEDSSDRMNKAFGSAMAGFQGFVTGLSTATATGSRAIGALTGAVTGALAGLQYGPWGAIVGGIGGLLGGILGKSSTQREQERLALEKSRNDIKLQVQQIEQARQQALSEAINALKVGREFLESLHTYTRVPKQAFQAFFKDMGRLVQWIADQSKKFTKELSEQVKFFSEGFKAGVELIAATPQAFEAINNHIPVAEGVIDRWGVDFEALLRKLGTIAESIPNKLEKEARKLGNRMAPVVGLFNESIAGIKEAFDLKPLPEGQIDLWANTFESIITKVGTIAGKFEKQWLKTLAFFSEQAAAGLAFWSAGVSAIKDMFEIKLPTEAEIKATFESITQGIQAGIATAEKFTVEGLAKAELIFTKSMAIFEAIKAAVEAFGALRDYKSVTSEAFEALSVDFRSALTWLDAFVVFGDKLADLAASFRDSMTEAAEALSEGVEKLRTIAQVSAAALSGLTVAASSGTIPTEFSGQSFATAGLRASSGSSTSSTVIHQDNRIFIDGIQAGELTPEKRRQLDEVLRLLGITQAAYTT